MKPAMLRMGLPSRVSGFEKFLSKKLTTQKSLVDPMIWQDILIYDAQ